MVVGAVSAMGLFWPDHIISVEARLRQGSMCERQADPECARSAFLAIPKKTELGKEVGALNVTKSSHGGRLCSFQGNWNRRKMK